MRRLFSQNGLKKMKPRLCHLKKMQPMHQIQRRNVYINSALSKYLVNNVLIQSDKLPCYHSPKNRDSKKGIVVIQEWWGMNKSIGNTADFLAEKGFQTVVPDLYRGKVAKDSEHAGHLMSNLNWEQAVRDIGSSLTFLRSQKCEKVGIVGFCMGGALTVAAAAQLPAVNAAVCFYGIPDLKSLNLRNISAPIQLHFGAKDSMKGFSDPESAQNLLKSLQEAGVSAELHFYPEAGHAFTNVDRFEVYHQKSAELAWTRTLDFFNTKLV